MSIHVIYGSVADSRISGRVPLPRPLGDSILAVIVDRPLLEDAASVPPAVGDLLLRLVAVVGTILHVRMIAVSAITIDVIVTVLEARMTGTVK